MVTHGARSTRIRVLAISGAFAVSIGTSTVTSSAAPASAPGVALTSTEVVRMPSAVSAPRQAGAPMDQSGERHVVPGMEMDKPGDAPDVPGMEMDKPAGAHEHGDAQEHGDAGGNGDAGEHGDAGGHGDGTEPATRRPLLPVLGTFGGGTAAVMLTAGMLRRKDRVRLEVRQAARAARRSGK